MQIHPITDEEFRRFQRLIFDKAGISLADGKQTMVTGRLQSRLRHHGLTRFGDYYRLVHSGEHPKEMQILVDLLTTNETYFFREPDHFDFVAQQILPTLKDSDIHIWSAACSSGEEVYTLAMLLRDKCLHKDWRIVGSDLSTRMLRLAQRGLYPLSRGQGIPTEYLSRYCLKGTRSHAGTFLINKQLKQHVHFKQVNLKNTLPSLGRFDIIFLRNVLIYFDQETKQQVVNRVVNLLKPGGYFFVSHTESLHGIAPQLKMIKPSVFQKR